jgi:prevent-host-death family protein
MATEDTGNKPEARRPVEANADDVRRVFGDYLSRVGFGNERIVIMRHGKRVAALVPMRDLESLTENAVVTVG